MPVALINNHIQIVTAILKKVRNLTKPARLHHYTTHIRHTHISRAFAGYSYFTGLTLRSWQTWGETTRGATSSGNKIYTYLNAKGRKGFKYYYISY
jgi:hypothetical protein